MIGSTAKLVLQAVIFAASFSAVVAQNLLPEEPDTPLQPVQEPETIPDAINPKSPGVTKFGQISVVGSEQQVRGGIASMARSLLSELNTLCNEKQRQMKLPLVIRLYG
ncbi:MAG: hypothetical protein AB8F34_00550, partial [Akkermansiaceae bacterium]